MDINLPIVTIVMATYNRSHFILDSLQSIHQQTFPRWECLIIDDGGTDNTLAVITTLLEKNHRFKYFKRPENYKKGLPGCRNYGIDIASGDYIIFFDDDDIVHPECLNFSVDEIKKGDVQYCRFLRSVFYENNLPTFDLNKNYTIEILEKKIYEKMIMGSIPFNSCQILWKKTCFENERFNENLMFAEEWELYSRILTQNIRGVNLTKVLYFGRKHPNSNTGEFFNNDPIRRASKKDAILEVIQNLREKDLHSNSMIKYFVQLSLQFKEFELFNDVLNKFDLSRFEKLKWSMFYIHLPIRIFFYRIYKSCFR